MTLRIENTSQYIKRKQKTGAVFTYDAIRKKQLPSESVCCQLSSGTVIYSCEKNTNKLAHSVSQRVDGNIFFLRENTEGKNEGNSLFFQLWRGGGLC